MDVKLARLFPSGYCYAVAESVAIARAYRLEHTVRRLILLLGRAALGGQLAFLLFGITKQTRRLIWRYPVLCNSTCWSLLSPLVDRIFIDR